MEGEIRFITLKSIWILVDIKKEVDSDSRGKNKVPWLLVVLLNKSAQNTRFRALLYFVKEVNIYKLPNVSETDCFSGVVGRPISSDS